MLAGAHEVLVWNLLGLAPMAIYRLLKNAPMGPEEIAVLTAA